MPDFPDILNDKQEDDPDSYRCLARADASSNAVSRNLRVKLKPSETGFAYCQLPIVIRLPEE